MLQNSHQFPFKGTCPFSKNTCHVVHVCIIHGQVKIISPDTHNPPYVITNKRSIMGGLHTQTSAYTHTVCEK